MRKTSVREIMLKSECKRKGFVESLGFEGQKGTQYHVASLIRKALSDNSFDLDYLDENLSADIYKIRKTRINRLKSIQFKVKRYLEYLNKHNVVLKNETIDVIKNGSIIPVKIDYVIDHGDFVEVVKFKTGKPHLSYRGRKFETTPENSIELLFLQEAGQLLDNSILKGRKVVASFHHLKSRKDKKSYENWNTSFNANLGDNIIAATVFSKKAHELAFELSKEENSFCYGQLSGECEYCLFDLVCSMERKNNLDLEIIEEKPVKAGDNFGLTDAQKKAVAFKEGIARINAGAGSGKTTVISIRIVELLKAGCSPEEILLITFTNKGAEEMREKVSFWLEKEKMDVDIDKINILTFNAWGEKIIKEKYEALGFTKEPTLIDRVSQYDTIIEILKEENEIIESFDYNYPLMNFRYAKGVVVQLGEAFEYIKGRNVSSVDELLVLSIKDKHYLSEMPTKDLELIMNLYETFNEKLKEKNLIEYQDQVNLILDLIEMEPKALEDISYSHIIVDEFQDSDKQQLQLIDYLSKKEIFKSLMVVGDDSQSIFGFRNTSQEYILNFDKYFDDVVDINMVDNFRSTDEILTLANRINDLNKNKIDKQLISSGGQGNVPSLKTHTDKHEEHMFILNSVQDDLRKGMKLEDIAIIARTKRELAEISEILTNNDIPNYIDVPEPILQNPYLHAAKIFSEYLEDNSLKENLLIFLEAVNLRDHSNKIEAIKEEKDMDKDILSIFEIESFSGKKREEIIEIIEKYDRMIQEKIKEDCMMFSYIDDNINITSIKMIDSFNKSINLKKQLLFFDILSLIDDEEFSKFMNELKERRYTDFHSMTDYLTKFVAYEDTKSVEVNDVKYKAILLTTAHSSKGREWDKVYVLMTKFMRFEEIDKLEEERRLLFVAITRAKKELTLSSELYDKRSSGDIKEFVTEVAQTNAVWVMK